MKAFALWCVAAYLFGVVLCTACDREDARVATEDRIIEAAR